jgi:hypothetical protein
MVVKNALKRLATLVDEALMKEERLRDSGEPPAPHAQEGISAQLRKETIPPQPPASLLEEVGVNEADTPLLSAIQSLNSQTAIPLNIHAEIYSLISPHYIQIASPRAIEPELLQPFETGMKEITLMFLASKKIITATVCMIHHAHFLVDTAHSTLCHKPGERLLALFPALPGKQYVLQTMIDEIYTGRLKLRYQDPRYDVRWQLRLISPVLMRLVPPTIITAIAQERTHIVRDILFLPSETPPSQTGSIADRLYQMNTAMVSPHMHLLENVSALPCGIHDISLGGACLALLGEHRSEALLHRVVRLSIPLPDLSENTSQTQYIPFVLEPFGVIRNVKTTAQPWTLHIRFLKRLPAECSLLFEHLEQQYVAQRTPLG